MAIHQFPAPPRPSGSKHLGHSTPSKQTPLQEDAAPSFASPSRPVRQHSVLSENQDVDCETDTDEDQVVVHVEVRQKPNSFIGAHVIKQNVLGFIWEDFGSLRVGGELPGWQSLGVLESSVDRIWVAESSSGETFVKVGDADIIVHVYRPSANARLEEFTATTEDDDEGDQVPAASVRQLPAAELDGLWDNLIYADDIKSRLLRYIHSTTAFSDASIDFNVVTWNRMVLLHGPPGTGKTSLCRALAQKLSIRLAARYPYGKIVEINSHSLFSKWFSESGKLVQKLFSTINEMVDDEDAFVVVMIDEVESLTAARAAAMGGNEPSDAVRVVNALLTQLDKLKTRKNVLVMTTSNIAGAIDPAFVDRADIKEWVGLPPPQAIYWILGSCLEQLMTGGLAKRATIAPWEDAELRRLDSSATGTDSSARLASLAVKCHEYNLAGRFLRRLPVLAHARYLSHGGNTTEVCSSSIKRWVAAMEKVVEDERQSRHAIARADGHWPRQEIGTAVAAKADSA